MWYIILAVLAVVLIVAFIFWRRRQRFLNHLATTVGFILPSRPDYEFMTANGVTVASQTEPTASEQVMLERAIDAGISEFLTSTLDKGWTTFRTHSDFVVWLLNPTSYSFEGYPSLNMMDGTKIAGIAYGVQTIDLPTPLIVIPYAPNHLRYVTAAVRHEAEHIGAWKSGDIEEAQRGSLPGHLHPLYPTLMIDLYSQPLAKPKPSISLHLHGFDLDKSAFRCGGLKK